MSRQMNLPTLQSRLARQIDTRNATANALKHLENICLNEPSNLAAADLCRQYRTKLTRQSAAVKVTEYEIAIFFANPDNTGLLDKPATPEFTKDTKNRHTIK